MGKKFNLPKTEVEDISFMVQRKHGDRILNISQLLTHDLIAKVSNKRDMEKVGFGIIVAWIGVALTDGYICHMQDAKNSN